MVFPKIKSWSQLKTFFDILESERSHENLLILHWYYIYFYFRVLHLLSNFGLVNVRVVSGSKLDPLLFLGGSNVKNSK